VGFHAEDGVRAGLICSKQRLAAGYRSGWHSHPGHSLIIVTAEAVTAYESDDPDCKPTTYTQGMGFVDSGGDHVHIIRNEDSVVASTVAVQLIPANASRRIDQPEPANCHLSTPKLTNDWARTNSMKPSLHLLHASAVLLLTAAAATANPILWTLTDVVLSDGATASGTFTFDPDAGAPCGSFSPCGKYTDVEIVTTTGSSRTGATYSFVCGQDVGACAGVTADSTEVLLLASNASNQAGNAAIAFFFTGVSVFPPQGLTDSGLDWCQRDVWNHQRSELFQCRLHYAIESVTILDCRVRDRANATDRWFCGSWTGDRPIVCGRASRHDGLYPLPELDSVTALDFFEPV
jgi:hypothetical protein